MNTKKILTENEILASSTITPAAHQSAFTLVCYFPIFAKYYGTHERFTFRGDNLAPNESQQCKALELFYFDLKNKHTINKAVIYDNRPGNFTPAGIVKRWFKNKLELNNERFILAKSEDYIFTPGALAWLCKQGLMQFEHETKKASFKDKCFFY
jgi:hypothetical protein